MCWLIVMSHVSDLQLKDAAFFFFLESKLQVMETSNWILHSFVNSILN